MNFEITGGDNSWTKYVLIILIAVGFYFIYQDHRIAEASPSWPEASGTIIESHITEQINNPSQKSNPIFAKRVYILNVQYQYEVNHAKITGTKIGKHAIQFDTEARASLALREFTIGTEVKVFYDPNSPKTSVLFPG